MKRNKKIKKLISEIVSAFSKNNYPKTEDIIYDSPVIDRSQAEVLRSRTWQSLSKDEIEQNPTALYVIVPQAYAYFLPAYLIYCLLHFEEGWPAMQNIVSSLNPTYEYQFVCLNKKQTEVIIKFIKLIITNDQIKKRIDVDSDRVLLFWTMKLGQTK